ncbi:hypothetical protein PthstB1num2_34880 [Parageobacillus thermoglucosidasius]|nr:hypothetical protein PthstB1num2_34880 [Parageobacillus thermoglucosidasius]
MAQSEKQHRKQRFFIYFLIVTIAFLRCAWRLHAKKDFKINIDLAIFGVIRYCKTYYSDLYSMN